MRHRPLNPEVVRHVREALAGLLGREVHVLEKPLPQPMELVVRYSDGGQDLVAAWVFERVLAWSLGAALTMVPSNLVEQAVSQGRDDADLEENFHEVVNVLATVTANVLGRRAVLESVSHDRQDLLRTARQISMARAGWSVLEISAEGYPVGNVAVSFVSSADAS